MAHQPYRAHTAVSEEALRGWIEPLKRFVTGIEVAALGQGERIDPTQLLAEFREAQGRPLPRLLASRGQPSPDAAGEQEAPAAPVLILPTKLLDRLVDVWGLSKPIADAATREAQGEPSDPDQLLTELTAALVKEEEAEAGPSASYVAASPAMPTSMIAGSTHAPTTPYRCKFTRTGRTRGFCCMTLQASSDHQADLKLTDLLFTLPRELVPTADSPKKNKKCKGTGTEKPCRD